MDKTFDDVERHRNEEDGNQACGQHPAEDGEAKQYPAMRTGSCRHDEWKHAEDKRKRRH